MFVVTYQNCFKFLGRSLDLTRKISSRGKHGSVHTNAVPKLVYLHNPLMFLYIKFQLAKLRLMWDHEFELKEFCKGTKQSVVVMTKCICQQNGIELGQFTTPVGFQQIRRDMFLSQNDSRLKLIRFRFEDIHRSIPVKVVFLKSGRNKSCFIDVLFVGLRNTKDFHDSAERQIVQTTLQQLEEEKRIQTKAFNMPHRILFAEIYMRFFRDYTPKVRNDWSVSFYKIITFDVLNYNPH